MIHYRNKRPDQGWPALFANWSVGDSFPVVGSKDYVVQCIFNYGMEPGDFTVESITPTMTRVTRIK